MKNLKKVILMALLLAASIVFNRFLSVKTPIVVVSFGFIPKLLIATLFGPWWSMLLFALADLIGSLLFPFGAYFVGYTITAAVSGLIYGLFLHRKTAMPIKKYLLRVTIACLASAVICTLLLNSIWVVVTTKKAVAAILPTRAVKAFVVIPIYVAIMTAIHAFFEKYKLYDYALSSRASLNSTLQDENLTENDSKDEKELEVKNETDQPKNSLEDATNTATNKQESADKQEAVSDEN